MWGHRELLWCAMLILLQGPPAPRKGTSDIYPYLLLLLPGSYISPWLCWGQVNPGLEMLCRGWIGGFKKARV